MESIRIPPEEITLSAIRAQGAGGQNVNKVSSAIHLRFDIAASSLPQDVKTRLLALHDSRISKDGVLVLKAQQHRTQEMNRFDALIRLHELANSVAQPPKDRKPTQPTRASRQRLREAKTQRSHVKAQRARVGHED
jgi:ribosome-associated protein